MRIYSLGKGKQMKSRKTRYERQLERKNRKSVTFVTKILGTAATIPACDVAGAARYLRLKTEGGRTASMEVMKEQLTVALQKGLLVKHSFRLSHSVSSFINTVRNFRYDEKSPQPSQGGFERGPLRGSVTAPPAAAFVLHDTWTRSHNRIATSTSSAGPSDRERMEEPRSCFRLP